MRKVSDSKNISFKMLIATLSGVFLEYFDLAVYGFSAQSIRKNFFPSINAHTGLILAWLGFSITFLMRPLGALVFGHFADRYGRKNILVFSIIIMSLTTVLIGLLPSYASIGVSASILLFVFRALQGFAVSTEYTGASIYLLEHLSNNRGLVSGIITSVSGFGIFLASSLVLMFTFLNHNDLHAIGWRFSFVIGGIVTGILGYITRVQLSETPEFIAYMNTRQGIEVPFLTLIKSMPKTFLRTVLVSIFVATIIILVENYLPSYLQQQGLDKALTLKLSTCIAFSEALLAILCGALSDKIKNTRLFFFGAIMIILFIFPAIGLLYSKNKIFYFSAGLILAFLVALFDGPMALYLVDQFPVQVRYSAVSMSYSLGVIVGGFSPALLSFGLSHIHGKLLLPLYLLILSILFVIIYHCFNKNESTHINST